jgi:hypothetical protein
MPRPPSALAPSVWTVVGAAVTIAATFMTWYETAIGPATAPDAVSGWSATLLGKVAVFTAAICLLSAGVIALDIRGSIALHGQTRRMLAVVSLVGAVVAAAVIAFRFLIPPDAAIGVTRELGLFLAVLAGLGTVLAAWVQLDQTGVRMARRPLTRRRPGPGPAPDAPR